MCGSLLGGRYSDYILKRLKEKNGGESEAEASSSPHGLLTARTDCLLDEVEEHDMVLAVHCSLHSGLRLDERTTRRHCWTMRDSLRHRILPHVCRNS